MYRKKMYDYIVIWWLTASKISIGFVKECIFLFWLNVSDLYWQNVAGEVRVRLTLVSPTTLYIYKNKGKCESIVCHKVGFTPERQITFLVLLRMISIHAMWYFCPFPLYQTATQPSLSPLFFVILTFIFLFFYEEHFHIIVTLHAYRGYLWLQHQNAFNQAVLNSTLTWIRRHLRACQHTWWDAFR